MFDIALNSTHEYIGKTTGAVYVYRPVPQCYKTEVNKIVSKAASSVIRKHQGNADAAKEDAQLTAGEVMIERRAELLYLLLRLCLRDVKGLASKGVALSIELEPAVIGGIDTTIVNKSFIDFLLENEHAGQELADLMDIIEGAIDLDDDSKKKSTVNDTGEDVRIQSTVPNVRGSVPKERKEPPAVVGGIGSD